MSAMKRQACGGDCGGGCGCEDTDPYEASLQAVWHNPTEYNVMHHGPSYLPGKKASADLMASKIQVQAALKNSAYYDAGSQMSLGMAPLATLLGVLRAASHIHQTHHWQTRGGHYYADHLLFQRLYEESQDFIDQVAERSVGAGSEMLVDAVQQVELMEHVVKAVCKGGVEAPETMIQSSLAMEQFVLGLLKAVIHQLESSGNLSPGTSNLLEGLGDKHEQFTYLLGQRSKTAAAYTYDRR